MVTAEALPGTLEYHTRLRFDQLPLNLYKTIKTSFGGECIYFLVHLCDGASEHPKLVYGVVTYLDEKILKMGCETPTTGTYRLLTPDTYEYTSTQRIPGEVIHYSFGR